MHQGLPCYLKDGILKRCVNDNKQVVEATVMLVMFLSQLLRQGHDISDWNSSVCTPGDYYKKGLISTVYKYASVKTCKQWSKQAMKYTNFTHLCSKNPMQFISVDLIGEFYLKSSAWNSYALTVISMLTGYTFCIPVNLNRFLM